MIDFGRPWIGRSSVRRRVIAPRTSGSDSDESPTRAASRGMVEHKASSLSQSAKKRREDARALAILRPQRALAKTEGISRSDALQRLFSTAESRKDAMTAGYNEHSRRGAHTCGRHTCGHAPAPFAWAAVSSSTPADRASYWGTVTFWAHMIFCYIQV